MNSDQMMQVATAYVEKEWARLGIAGTAESKADEISREYDRLKRAVTILTAAGCVILVPDTTQDGPR